MLCMEKICVIVTNYNLNDYIGRCLDSIIGQTYTYFEVIIVDDGSTDGSEHICDLYAERDERIHVLHKSHAGISAARNDGLKWAFGNHACKWVTFIDGDDWVHFQYLEILYGAAKTSKLPISACKLKRVHAMCKDEPFEMTYRIETSEDVFTSFRKEVAAYACSKLFLKELYFNIVFPEGKLFEDVFVPYKILLQSEYIAYIPETLYYYYFNMDGIVHSDWKKSRLDEFEAFDNLIYDLSKLKRWSDSLPFIKESYIREISYSYFKEQKSRLSKNEKRYYAHIISKKMRSVLRRYRKDTKITFRDHKYVYEVAYPGLMYLYWLGQSLLGKVKRIMNNK